MMSKVPGVIGSPTMSTFSHLPSARCAVLQSFALSLNDIFSPRVCVEPVWVTTTYFASALTGLNDTPPIVASIDVALVPPPAPPPFCAAGAVDEGGSLADPEQATRNGRRRLRRFC